MTPVRTARPTRARPYRVLAWRARLSRDEWLALRRRGLGSSDAPVILGLSPWQSPYTLWLDKCAGLADAAPDTAYQSWGRRLESVVAAWVAENTGWPVAGAGAVLQSRPHPILLADLDRWITHPTYGRIPLEIKTTSATQRTAWQNGPPPAVLAQVWHQCVVTAAPAAIVAVAWWGDPPQVFLVEPTPDDLAGLVAREEAWWTTHVVQRVPPPLDGHPATTAALDQGAHDGPAVPLPPEAGAWLAERVRLVAQSAALDRAMDDLDNRLKSALGDAQAGLLGGRIAARWIVSTRRSVDVDRLVAEHPDLAAAYVRETVVRRWDTAPGMKLVAAEGSEVGEGASV